MALNEEVNPDSSSAKRSQTTGHLIIEMPKVWHTLNKSFAIEGHGGWNQSCKRVSYTEVKPDFLFWMLSHSFALQLDRFSTTWQFLAKGLLSCRFREGCPIYPFRNGLLNWWRSVMDHNNPSQLSVCDMSAIECRPPHLYECLWRHYFRMRNIVTLLSPVCVVCDSSQSITPFGDPLQIGCIGHVWVQSAYEPNGPSAWHLTPASVA